MVFGGGCVLGGEVSDVAGDGGGGFPAAGGVRAGIGLEGVDKCPRFELENIGDDIKSWKPAR